MKDMSHDVFNFQVHSSKISNQVVPSVKYLNSFILQEIGTLRQSFGYTTCG